MSNVSVAQARKDLAHLVSRASYGKERIVVEKHGKPACAIIPIVALKALEEWERKEDKGRIQHLCKAIDGLVTEPRPNGCKKLSGGKSAYRIRVGEYRVVYEILHAPL